ncbi:peroxisomal biogenesis factor 16 [Lycorma delicatula]|uniref:peroxisomal biogenesis factor 16 n=1 Tax=Lycorma delicatula TaxID=130591 RepID=UPI003F51050C
MAIILRSFPEIFNKYQEWVCENPQLASEIESSVKWISYLIAGKVSESNVLSELVYSISNLWVLFNDKIILSAHNRCNSVTDLRDSIKTWLTVLEYSEVFIEISTRQVWGRKVKWIVIVLIQSFKCILRLLLILKFNETILPNPPISPLRRKTLEDERINDVSQNESVQEGFMLKSGRTIRTVNSATSSARSWKPPSPLLQKLNEDNSLEHQLTSTQCFGEALYIVKPLIHLGSMYCHGQKSWEPWLISLIVDISSIMSLKSLEEYDYNKHSMKKQQMLELQRRKLMLILYLLRSPFYDRFTKHRLNKCLLAVSETIPLTGLILRPLVDYLPRWQDTHLYLWSS